MTLRLYDTGTRSVRDFTPLREDEVSVYYCGATVQAAPHVGHLRPGVVFDVLRRWLMAKGYNVTLVRNVTDVDDKIIAKAAEEQRPWWAVAQHYEREFTHAYDILGVLPPTVEPRATGHIPQMHDLISRLIADELAYNVDGDVYFSVSAYADYGQLSRQRLDDLQPAADSADDPRKRDPRDFALWKAAKPGEPAWDSPWGPGRPGWHLECSAMATWYLGEQFDIHGGGIDLIFPHHENEQAQSRAAGDGFARYWMHNAWVTAAGQKMGKSLGNALAVDEVLKHVRPVELRYHLAAAHYRSPIEFSYESVVESAAGFRRILGFLEKVTDEPLPAATAQNCPEAFVAAMDDDLGVPAAVAVIFDTVRAGNSAAERRDEAAVRQAWRHVSAMSSVLGINPLEDPWVSHDAGSEQAMAALGVLVDDLLAARQQARADKDWAGADAIRDRLLSAGIAIEDRADGPVWSVTSRGR
ncbi:MAG: cysteine--tRNA ligase [Candidatus Nanopelagicales bacterium]|nr:cysteine--tRNA ligase [Candidatus Nanopelagicales bacterium]MCU0298876.1 cysteine--tRNA ligase [Candidatus Nanopelagicales bacterium]